MLIYHSYYTVIYIVFVLFFFTLVVSNALEA
uniref:Uncharacterized protein n=1 Tax=Anguilla anguilla TaxID=7936 RepID=A0A0E9VV13_ANGAN